MFNRFLNPTNPERRLDPNTLATYMKTEHIILHLSLIEGIGPGTIQKLVERLQTIGNLYDLKINDLCQYGINIKQARLIVEGLADQSILNTEIELLQRYNIKLITCIDKSYPALLKHIHLPPSVLYYKGADLSIFEKNIAIVGSRKADQHAEQIISSWMPGLIELGWTVVSGGAIGVDTMAHRAALQLGGNTIVVLGSGLLYPYPRSNMRMFETVAMQGGALVSPFPLQMQPLSGNFPARNRIISGLSQACLVVQAAKKSGASITAGFALEQGRTVLAVPGSVFDELHEGCHALIKEGATLVGSVQELLVELGEVSPATQTTQMSIISPPSRQPLRKPLSSGASIEQQVIYYCSDKALSIDDLIQHTGLSLEGMQDQLFNLQLAGKIEQNAVGLWQVRSV